MRKLSKIKDDVDFYEGFSGIIDACKMVALSEFRALEKKVSSFERLVNIVESFFMLIESSDIQHPFISTEGRPQGIIMITSDQGLSGGLDTKVASAAINQLKAKEDQLIVIGSKGLAYAQSVGVKFVEFPGMPCFCFLA